MQIERLTITQRIKIIKTYNKNGDSATATYRALRGDYGVYIIVQVRKQLAKL